MSGDSYIQVPADDVGKKVEAVKIKRGDVAGTEVERQVMSLPEAKSLEDLLKSILIELQLQSLIMASAFDEQIDLDTARGSIGDRLT